jgi:hypothetical protein
LAAELAKSDPALARTRVSEIVQRLRAATESKTDLPQHAATLLADGLPEVFIR